MKLDNDKVNSWVMVGEGGPPTEVGSADLKTGTVMRVRVVGWEGGQASLS